MTVDDPHVRFRRLFAEAERDLLAYALRRVDRPADAADIVADTFSWPGGAWTTCRPAPKGGCGCTASRAASWPVKLRSRHRVSSSCDRHRVVD